jgi:hypothetical protein
VTDREREEEVMLIINDNHRLRAGVATMDERCTYCSKALNEYPLIMSDEARPSVYHAACALQLATDIMVDLYTFFCPPAPYDRLFVIAVPQAEPHP